MATAIEQYIRQAAAARDINPNIAVAVAKSEGGLNDPVRQSEVVKNGVREQSYGPFQLYLGGGLGNKALQAGIDPRDPNQWQRGVDFALDAAKQGGWGPWYGAKAIGVTGKMGIGGNPANVPAPSQYANMPDGPKGQESYPIMGSMAPTMMAGNTAAPPAAVPPSVLSQASQSPSDRMASIFGAMALGNQDQGPQFAPVQIQGPSPEQSMALANFIKAMTGRMA